MSSQIPKRAPLWRRLKRAVQQVLQPKVEAIMSDRLGELEARLQARIQTQHGKLQQKISHLESHLESQLTMPPPSTPEWRRQVQPGAAYIDFENIFRDPIVIAERNKRYLTFIQDQEPVLDIGCGRGEFLELLRDQTIAAGGIDSSPEMIAACRQKNLTNTEVSDAITYLRRQRDATLGSIFCCHVIEHLPVDSLREFFTLAWKKIKPGGVLIVETVNPHNLPAFKLFWLDPTHQHPLFPEYLEWCCRSGGFSDVGIHYLTETGFTTANLAHHGNYALIARVPISTHY